MLAMTDAPRPEAGPLTPEEEGDLAVLLARKYGTYPDGPRDLRERIETNLRQAERRDDDFYRGKASAFRVVLSMLDGPPKPTFVCARTED